MASVVPLLDLGQLLRVTPSIPGKLSGLVLWAPASWPPSGGWMLQPRHLHLGLDLVQPHCFMCAVVVSLAVWPPAWVSLGEEFISHLHQGVSRQV